MRSIFYSLSALAILVVVSLFFNIQHNIARSQENAVLEMVRGGKIVRAYTNIMSELLKCLGTSIEIERTSSNVILDVGFNSTLNSTDVDDQHFYHILSNTQRYRELVKYYGQNELSFDDLKLDTISFETYLFNSSQSFLYSVEPYGFDYVWRVGSNFRDDSLTITRQAIAGDQVEIIIGGPAPNSVTATCCQAKNLTFGVGNVTIVWAPDVVLDFSKLETSLAGFMQVRTSLRLPSTDERVRVKLRGVLLNITDMNTNMHGNTVRIG